MHVGVEVYPSDHPRKMLNGGIMDMGLYKYGSIQVIYFKREIRIADHYL